MCCSVEDQSWDVYRQTQWYEEQPGIPRQVGFSQQGNLSVKCVRLNIQSYAYEACIYVMYIYTLLTLATVNNMCWLIKTCYKNSL